MRRRSPVIATRSAPAQAKADIAKAAQLVLTERDSLRMLDLLEIPPAAADRLKRVAKAGFKLL